MRHPRRGVPPFHQRATVVHRRDGIAIPTQIVGEHLRDVDFIFEGAGRRAGFICSACLRCRRRRKASFLGPLPSFLTLPSALPPGAACSGFGSGVLGHLGVFPSKIDHQKHHHQRADATRDEDGRDHLMRLILQVSKFV